ncbi:MAG: type II secretion system F family protein [Candidatus Omnitrophota bacterium]|nr:MAG: type II secretion system F family protein [Candidatus Omnitrophota bacterium]
MAVFTYTVKDKAGKIIKGYMEAEAKEMLIEHFHKEGYVIFSIEEARKKIKAHRRGRIKADDLVIFSRQFTTLIESNVPAVEALAILKEQTEKQYFKDVITAMLKDVKEGAALSSALSKHPKVFPEIYVSMVEAAEISGNLSEILERVSLYLEKDSALRKKVASALYYPVVIVLMAVGITGFLMVKVIPTFKNIFDMLGGQLTLATRILITVSDMVSRKAFLIGVAAFFIGGFALFRKYISTPKGKRNYHRVLVGLPVFGNLIKKIAIARFSRTFATLVKSGVPIVRCLDIVAKTSGNKIIEDAVLKSKKLIQEGQPISMPLEETKIFPPMVTKMIYIGEKSGRLEEMLSKIAQFYEEQTEALIAGMASMIEPLIILFLGIVVGGIVISLFLPIIKITQYLG